MRTLQPPGWPRPRGYANGVAAEGGTLVFVAGQIGWDETGAFPAADLPGQVRQTLRNVLAVLAEAGSGPENVAKLTIYLAPDIDPGAAYAATRSVWGDHRTAVTVIAVRPARPGALVEIEAVAALAEG